METSCPREICLVLCGSVSGNMNVIWLLFCCFVISMCGILGRMRGWTGTELEKAQTTCSKVNKKKWICQITGEHGTERVKTLKTWSNNETFQKGGENGAEKAHKTVYMYKTSGFAVSSMATSGTGGLLVSQCETCVGFFSWYLKITNYIKLVLFYKEAFGFVKHTCLTMLKLE